MFYVQHLLGVGHLQRAAFIARELASAGIETHLVSGGTPTTNLSVLNVRFHQLTPVRSLDGLFDKLVDEHDEPIDDDWCARRCDQLLSILSSIQPHALITETFPFGRRMMSFELLPLLDAAKAMSEPPLIVASIRDILQPKSKPGREEEACERVLQYYDHVLVHGDPNVATLADTFGPAKEIASRVEYTGYIAAPGEQHSREVDLSDAEILVSGGGSSASLPLLENTLNAFEHSSQNYRHWRVLVGHGHDQTTFEALQRAAPDGVTVERNRPDFQRLMANCAVSVSQAGYNTVVDLLRCGARSVLVPFAQGIEIEQTIRANLMADRGIAITLPESELTPKALADCIDRAMLMQPRDTAFKMDGAAQSAQFILQWLTKRGA
ncbi:MAG: glycosyltransferase [Pseudomonadota bacterium]